MKATNRWIAWTVAIGFGLLAVDALARVGGGQDFHRSPSGGGGGGGGGGDVPIELLFLVLQLVVRYPVIGIPLVLVLAAVVVGRLVMTNLGGPAVHRTGPTRSSSTVAPRSTPVPGLAALRQRDPGYSSVVLLDFVVLVHRRALDAVGTARGIRCPRSSSTGHAIG